MNKPSSDRGIHSVISTPGIPGCTFWEELPFSLSSEHHLGLRVLLHYLAFFIAPSMVDTRKDVLSGGCVDLEAHVLSPQRTEIAVG